MPMETNPFSPPKAPVADVIANAEDAPPGHQDISRSELTAFAGDNKYPEKWIKRIENKTRFAGFNAWAFLFGILWFFYRKLYFQGVFSFLLEAGVPFLVAFAASSYFGKGQEAQIAGLISIVAIRVLIGYWANLALYNEAVRTIHHVDSLNLDNEEHLRQIANTGRISVMSLLAVWALLLFLQHYFGFYKF
mgnify:CR=1 FL=1